MNNAPENLLETLRKEYSYADKLEDLLKAKKRQEDEIIKLKKEPAGKKNDYIYGRRAAIILAIIWGFSIFMAAKEEPIDVIIPVCLILIGIPLSVALVLTFLIRQNRKNIAEMERQLPEKLKKPQEALNEIESKIQLVISDMGDSGLLGIIPERYFNTEALGFFLHAVQNKMANSLQECILLYEQELKHQQMLNQQMELAEYQSAQLDKLTREVEILEKRVYNND